MMLTNVDFPYFETSVCLLFPPFPLSLLFHNLGTEILDIQRYLLKMNR